MCLGPELNGLLRGSGAGAGGADNWQFCDDGDGVVVVVGAVGDGLEDGGNADLSGEGALMGVWRSGSGRRRDNVVVGIGVGIDVGIVVVIGVVIGVGSFSPAASAANIFACKSRWPSKAIWASNSLKADTSDSDSVGSRSR